MSVEAHFGQTPVFFKGTSSNRPAVAVESPSAKQVSLLRIGLVDRDHRLVKGPTAAPRQDGLEGAEAGLLQRTEIGVAGGENEGERGVGVLEGLSEVSVRVAREHAEDLEV